MNLHQIKADSKKRESKRLGRGYASGKGKTSTRGHKGQKSRSGHNIPNRFEGGQTSLIQRLPKKRGFKSKKQPVSVVKLIDIAAKFNSGDLISPKTLLSHGLVENKQNPIKIIGANPDKLVFNIKGLKFSKSIKNEQSNQ